MKLLATALVALALLGISAHSAEADSIDWKTGVLHDNASADVASSGGDYRATWLEWDYTGGTLRVTGYRDDGATASQVYYDRDTVRRGLGVQESGFDGDDEQIDVTTNEVLRLVFSTPVELISADFANMNHGTTFSTGTDFDLNGTELALAGTVSFASGAFVGTTFEFSAPDADYYLSKIEFSAVPEPSTAALLALGFAGAIVVVRRRRNRVA